MKFFLWCNKSIEFHIVELKLDLRMKCAVCKLLYKKAEKISPLGAP